MRLSEGLIVAHICLALSFLIGSSVFPPRPKQLEESSATAMIRLLCTCGLGFAVFGLAAFLLLLIGLFTVPWIIFSVLLICAGGSILWKGPIWRRVWWRQSFGLFRRAIDGPSLIVYYALILLALPAVNLVNIGSDAIGYHYAYAAEWAATGHLIVDPFLRDPFYASNFLLILAALFAFKANVFAIFMTWAMALLTALGICAGSREVLESKVARSWANVIGIFLTAAVVLSPSCLRWLDSGYIDVSIGALALLSVLSIMLAAKDHEAVWLYPAAAIAGFFIGMKISFLPLIVAYVLALATVVSPINKRRSFYMVVLLFIVCSAPWYARNWIDAGDPIAPVLNLTLYGHDGLITAREAAQIVSDLGTDHSIRALMTLPARAFFYADSDAFREYGTSALILFLYLPILLLAYLLFWRKQIAREEAALLVVLVVFVAYWALTSSFLRYTIMFTPLLAVFTAVVLGRIALRIKWFTPIAAVLSFLAIFPTPGSRDFYQQFYLSQFRYLPGGYTSDEAYLQRFGDGYHEATFAAATLKQYGLHGRLYVLGARLNYYLYTRGISAAGDWVGPAGYLRLFDAVDAHQAAQFMAAVDADAVLIEPSKSLEGLDVPLTRQLYQVGFIPVQIPDSKYRLLIREEPPSGGGSYAH